MKVGICGPFGLNKNLINGQTIKTKSITQGLINYYGEENIAILDSYNWKKNPIKFLMNCVKLIKKSENIILLPAQRGVKVFIPLFNFLNRFFHKKVHYVVIGAWIDKILKESPFLLNQTKKLAGVYVETTTLQEELEKLAIDDVHLLVNFKKINRLTKESVEMIDIIPRKLVTFSRVSENKGIPEAIKTVNKINEDYQTEIYTLDIYGPVDLQFKEEFEELLANSSSSINYLGEVDSSESVEILKDYYLLLFPTQLLTEGLPGTIIDAYAAALPVIASNWNSAKEIIRDGKTGFVYSFDDLNHFYEILVGLFDQPERVKKMKLNCLTESKKYSEERVIEDFVNYLK